MGHVFGMAMQRQHHYYGGGGKLCSLEYYPSGTWLCRRRPPYLNISQEQMSQTVKLPSLRGHAKVEDHIRPIAGDRRIVLTYTFSNIPIGSSAIPTNKRLAITPPEGMLHQHLRTLLDLALKSHLQLCLLIRRAAEKSALRSGQRVDLENIQRLRLVLVGTRDPGRFGSSLAIRASLVFPEPQLACLPN